MWVGAAAIFLAIKIRNVSNTLHNKTNTAEKCRHKWRKNKPFSRMLRQGIIPVLLCDGTRNFLLLPLTLSLSFEYLTMSSTSTTIFSSIDYFHTSYSFHLSLVRHDYKFSVGLGPNVAAANIGPTNKLASRPNCTTCYQTERYHPSCPQRCFIPLLIRSKITNWWTRL